MKILRLAFILLIGFNSHLSIAQAPNWQWARSVGGSNNEEAFAVTTDANGNIYITGYFSSTIITFGNTLLSVNNGDIFLVKYDPAGNVVWAKNTGGGGNDIAHAICTDINGNIYIAGGLKSPTLTFGTSTLNNANSPSSKIFLAKFDAFGNPLWARDANTNPVLFGNDEATGIKADAAGNVYITGFFNSNSITFDTTTLINAGETDVFIAKYDPSGNMKWAKRAGGDYYDQANGITTDSAGNIYITGSYSAAPISFGDTTLPNGGLHSGFTVKYDPSGDVLWACSDSGRFQENAICIDSRGNVIVAGDDCILKYNSFGNLIWSQKVRGLSVCTDQHDMIYVTGYFFDNDTIGNTILINSGTGIYFTSDIYVAGVDPSGNVIWAKSAKGSDNDLAFGIASDPSGNIYVAGAFESDTLIFDNNIVINSFFNETDDIFLAKIGDFSSGISSINPTSPITVYPNPSTGSFYFSGVTEGSTIEVYDLMGQSILNPGPSPKEKGGTAVVNLSGRASGVYFYRVSDQNNTIQTGKLVVE